jgi:hypothetical protein
VARRSSASASPRQGADIPAAGRGSTGRCYPAIVWLDTRAEAEARRLNEMLDAEEMRALRGALGDQRRRLGAEDSCGCARTSRRSGRGRGGIVMLPDFIGHRLTGRVPT